jgi:hypothetical protein
VPLLFAGRITTGLLALLKPRMRHKPPSANTTRTFLGVSLTTHGFPPLLGYDNMIQTNLIGESTPRYAVGLI